MKTLLRPRTRPSISASLYQHLLCEEMDYEVLNGAKWYGMTLSIVWIMYLDDMFCNPNVVVDDPHTPHPRNWRCIGAAQGVHRDVKDRIPRLG